jgi:hypothetical protein
MHCAVMLALVGHRLPASAGFARACATVVCSREQDAQQLGKVRWEVRWTKAMLVSHVCFTSDVGYRCCLASPLLTRIQLARTASSRSQLVTLLVSCNDSCLMRDALTLPLDRSCAHRCRCSHRWECCRVLDARLAVCLETWPATPMPPMAPPRHR